MPPADGSVSTFSVYINSININSINIKLLYRQFQELHAGPERGAVRMSEVLQSGIYCLLHTARRYIVCSTAIGHAVRNGKARAAVSTSSQALYTTPYNTVQHRCIEYQCFYAAHCTGAPNIENTTQHAHAARAAGTMARQGRCATDFNL